MSLGEIVMDLENKKLKPYPFCGYVAGIYTDTYEDYDGTMLYNHYVKCKRASCLVQPSTKPAERIDEVIAAWNRRTNDGENVCKLQIFLRR